MEKNSIIGNVYRTDDYSIFGRLEGNRKLLSVRVGKIMRSINEFGYIYNPIVVNEHYQVIDGQGRLEALQTLGLPVDFVIANGAGIKECIALNASQTPWSIKDYIESYCELGIADYIRLRELVADFPEIQAYNVYFIAAGVGNAPNNLIKDGNFLLPETQADSARSDLVFLRDCMPYLRKVSYAPRYYGYALAFAKHCNVPTDRLFLVISRSDLPIVHTIEDALDKLSDLYNWKLSPDKRIYLRVLYDQTNTKAFGWYHPNWISPVKNEEAI